jgi:archaellum component FlaG (FlaF/FlaG flagellin family)
MKLPEPKFVVCIKNKGYAASLELRKLYQVVVDDNAAKLHQIRVIDESGEDYLYPGEYFVAVQMPQSAERAVRRAAIARG